MKVRLISCTPDPELVVAVAAKLCYSSLDVDRIVEGMTSDEVSRLIRQLLASGHMSPLEHANFTFAIEDVSRSLLAQITRHRIASFSVQSQRYVDMKDASMVVPPAFKDNEDVLQMFAKYSQLSLATYRQIADDLSKGYVQNGMDPKSAKKKAQEDARFVLPNACTTQMITTMNARQLLHFFNMRCCNRAQWEIRQLADAMLALAYKQAPTIFENAGPSCISTGHCSEGSMCCGHPRSKQEVRGACT